MNDEEMEKLEKEEREYCQEIAKQDGKCFGVCETCEHETVLVEDIGMCGPCTFGEAETYTKKLSIKY